MKPLAVTGWALASPFGHDPDAFWDGICHGPTPRAAWRSEPDFPGLGCHLAPLAPAAALEAAGHPPMLLAADLARRALRTAGLESAPAGCGLAVGAIWLDLDYLSIPRRRAPEAALPYLARTLGLTGPMASTPVACAAGNIAIAWACDRLRRGEAPMMLAGGLDLAGPTAIGGYTYLDVFTDDLPRPFDQDRDGFLLGEGGAMFVLEPLEAAHAAGRPVLATVVGVGGGHDGSHPTRPADDGRGLVAAMRRALTDAGLAPEAIGYLNAHGPGTPANDPGEAAAIATVFGPHALPVSSTKGALGHAQGGANALEALACMLALRHRQAPPTLNLDHPDPSLPLDLVAGEPRALVREHALSLASSMGGASSALIFQRGDAWA